MTKQEEEARIAAAVQKQLEKIVMEQQKQFSKMMEKTMKDSLKGVDKANATLRKERDTVMKELDAAFHFTNTGNAEIAFLWLQLSIRHGYAPANDRLHAYLLGIGRRKLILPLYSELAKTPVGKVRALEIYKQARPGYHPLAQGSIDLVLGLKN